MSTFTVLIPNDSRVPIKGVLISIIADPRIPKGISFPTDSDDTGTTVHFPIGLKPKLFPDDKPWALKVENSTVLLFPKDATLPLRHIYVRASSHAPEAAILKALEGCHVAYLRARHEKGISPFVTGDWFVGIYSQDLVSSLPINGFPNAKVELQKDPTPAVDAKPIANPNKRRK